ncbi:MAG: hypothetical protein LBU84_15585 [Prevotella sp.]|jgi:hypothetical protein|nr:hypothetical protein [Prevotella sp.]
MKEIKIIIKESIDKDSDTLYIASLEVYPEIKAEAYSQDDARIALEKDISMKIGFKQIDLDSFPDFSPEKFEIECGVYREAELEDNDLYIFIVGN